jgi:[ribosomal protein S18]-alanine N-acetyltransferase
MEQELEPMESDARYVDTPYLVRPMRLEDLDEVLRIEQASFPVPWPASAFRYDLTKNHYAYYFVAARRAPLTDRPADAGLKSFWQRLWSGDTSSAAPILGYIGYWCLVDEAHIANIAVAEDWRGRGLGELLMIAVLDHALAQGMTVVTLEVRVSNQVAQALYQKFGFVVAGNRRRYYSDNGEDALIMTTEPIASEPYQARLAELKRALADRLNFPAE